MNKLEKCPPIFWINLDKCTERKEYMEQLFNDYHLNHARIPAYDGENYTDFCIIDKKNIDTKEQKGEIGCLCSHLKALETFVSSDPSVFGEYALICEDDLSFEYLPYWQKSFWEYINSAPPDFSIIQLSLTYAYQYMIRNKQLLERQSVHQLKKHEPYMYGAVIYLITRHAATILLQKVKKQGNKYDLTALHSDPISDCFIYNNMENVYTFPLFTTNTTFNSSIHSEHIERIHIPSKNIITEIWKENKTK